MANITRTVTRHIVKIETGHGVVELGEYAKVPALTEIKKKYKEVRGEDWSAACIVMDIVQEKKYTMDLETFIANAEEVSE